MRDRKTYGDGVSTSALSPLGKTLLTPLYARAYAADLLPELGFIDQHAVALIVRVHAKRHELLTDLSSVAGMVMRTMLFDQLTREFTARYPNALIVAAGVGLCARNLRLAADMRSADWVGVDLPEVIALRGELMPADPMPLVAASVGRPGFLDEVDVDGRPTLVLAEGVLPYLSPAEVRVFLTECTRLPVGSQIVADVFHPIVSTFAMHPISWATGAPMRSGASSARDLASTVPGLRVAGEHDFMERIGGIPELWAAWTRSITWGGRLYTVAQLEIV